MVNQLDKNAATIAARLASDWSNAYVIACSVEKGVGNGRPPTETVEAPTVSGKESGQAFARRIKALANGSVYGMGVGGVLATLDKWNEIAAEHGLPTSDQLTPEDAETEPTYPDIAWKREGTGSKVKDIVNNPGAVAEALRDPRFADKVADRASADAKQNAARSLVDQAALDAPDVKTKVRKETAIHDRIAEESVDKAVNPAGSAFAGALSHGGQWKIIRALKATIDEAEAWIETPDAADPANRDVLLRNLREQRFRIQAIELVLDADEVLR
jgi:hypothetical protein